MNNPMENIEKFDQYLQELLEEDQREDFEKKLENDAELKKDFLRHQVLVDGIKLHGRKALLDEMKSWDNEIKSIGFEPTEEKSISFFKWYYAAAAISIILVTIAVLYSSLNTGYDRIVASHYQPYTYISDIQRGEAIEENPTDKIFQYYDQGNYQQTVQLINEVPESQRSELMSFIQANAYQAMEDYERAIPIFDSIADSNSVYAFGSKWYLSLCYLSVDQPDKAVTLLNELKATNSSFAPKAEKLLNDLD